MTASAIDVGGILRRLAACSERPHFTFMVLNLISEATGPNGSVGPVVPSASGAVPVRDWLSDTLAPLTEQNRRRARLTARVAASLADELPADPIAAAKMLDVEIRDRIRRSGKTNVSRAVSDLVRAGLLRRHYAGWRTNHENRGGQRQAVYTIEAGALAALRRKTMLL